MDVSQPDILLRLAVESGSLPEDILSAPLAGGEQSSSDELKGVKKRLVWDAEALEINLRPGGATHPTMTLRLLVNGEFDLDTGLFTLKHHNQKVQHRYELVLIITTTLICSAYLLCGLCRYYVATDNLHDPLYVGLSPADVIDFFRGHTLGFDGKRATGTVSLPPSLARYHPTSHKLFFFFQTTNRYFTCWAVCESMANLAWCV